jgi:hypothetical protein
MTAYLLKDRYFDPETSHISSYFCQLFILVREDCFQFAILDSDKNKFIALVDYGLQDTSAKSEQLRQVIEEIISKEELLQKKYPSVVVGIENQFHTLVPLPLFEVSQAGKYLEFNFRIPSKRHIQTDMIEEINAVNVSCFQEGLLDVFSKKYSREAIVHSSTAIIRAAYWHHMVDPGSSCLFLYAGDKTLDLVMFDGNKPVLFNSFTVETKEDLLYFTLFVTENSGQRPDQVYICLGGEIDENSDSYRLIAQYFKSVSFLPRLSTFNYSAIFDSVGSHRYQDLFALALCGS